jgi:hypothetical protein
VNNEEDNSHDEEDGSALGSMEGSDNDDDESYTPGNDFVEQLFVEKKKVVVVENNTAAVKVKSAKKQEPSSTGKVSAKTGAALLPFAKCKNKVDGDDNVSKLLLDSDYGGDDAPKKGKGKRVKDSPISFAAKHSKKGVDQSVNHAHGVLPVVDVAEVIHFFNLP